MCNRNAGRTVTSCVKRRSSRQHTEQDALSGMALLEISFSCWVTGPVVTTFKTRQDKVQGPIMYVCRILNLHVHLHMCALPILQIIIQATQQVAEWVHWTHRRESVNVRTYVRMYACTVPLSSQQYTQLLVLLLYVHTCHSQRKTDQRACFLVIHFICCAARQHRNTLAH